MSKLEDRQKSRNSGRLAGFAAENMLLSECRMTAAASARTATFIDRGSQTGPVLAASRMVRGMASGRNPQTSMQEQYS